jgi:hypothetical protein
VVSDAETVDVVTFDLRWKAAPGLPVAAGAFRPTTFTYWRRLAGSDRPNRIFDAVKEVVAQIGCSRARLGVRWTRRCPMARSPPNTR